MPSNVRTAAARSASSGTSPAPSVQYSGAAWRAGSWRKAPWRVGARVDEMVWADEAIDVPSDRASSFLKVPDDGLLRAHAPHRCQTARKAACIELTREISKSLGFA